MTKLLKRKDVPVEYTWDLSLIFSNDKVWEEEFRLLSAKISAKEQYEGTLKGGAQSFLNALEWQLYMIRSIQKVYAYALLKNNQDTTDANSQILIGKATSLYAQIAKAISWFEPELLSLPDHLLIRYFEELPKLSVYQHYIEEITSQRDHVRSAEVEDILASAIDVLNSFSNTFEKLSDSDLKFEDIENVDGSLVQLTNSNYTSFLESSNRNVRKAAFGSIYRSFEQFQHSFASTLNGEVKKHVFSARVRNYTCTREASLSKNKIPELVYDQLIKIVNKNLSLLHRYIALRKKILKIENLQPYDLYTSLLGDIPIKFTFEEAKEKIIEALTPLGENYINHVKYIFENRVIDVYENEGKRSGAFSSGMYDTEPYILLNWQDNIESLYTLIHELGHSMHSYYTRTNQPYVYGNYPIFLAEIASATNENLLTEYFLSTEKKKEIRAYILNHYLDGFKGSVFRQTQFAEFEHFIHQQAEDGIPLTADFLSKNYGTLNERYYGSALSSNLQIKFEWARIPHFYFDYYVYQYATGFALATAFTKKIIQKNELELYLTFLKAGNSDYPLKILNKSGLDVRKTKYLKEAFSVFERRLNELESLT